ncbi:nuclear transport factor 2 family protein [Novosphingobium umbonatum]|uniref:Nuclear transport factor 2 family protein n=1 Tax=Novosphingobium umbonatum TaxID=1908524 RepID=A0A3S2UT97_9SPHN|nr:nuclear transport factor 2 family protein [Novosphingobium umbonatum]RVU05735.1 nuclear transport factor 2 family protein [Novosphingobium umbonatum]
MSLSAEDRFAIADVVNGFALAVDDIGNVDGVVALFAPDAVYDLSALGMGTILGQEGVGEFFTTAFAGMAHNAHYMTNITASSTDAGAKAQAYGHAFSLGKDGAMMEVKARYNFDLVRSEKGWLIARLTMGLLIPMG